jgi:hypothetical protein
MRVVGRIGGRALELAALVALAANMVDNADELRVIQYLNLASWRFLEQVKYHRLILNGMMSNCAEDEAVAKSQEISRTWSDATSLVQSVIKKIGAGPPSVLGEPVINPAARRLGLRTRGQGGATSS